MTSRRGLAVAVAGGMALIGAVLVLRATVTPVPHPTPAEPAPTVAPYTAPGVTIARLAGPPQRPQRPEIEVDLGGHAVPLSVRVVSADPAQPASVSTVTVVMP